MHVRRRDPAIKHQNTDFDEEEGGKVQHLVHVPNLQRQGRGKPFFKPLHGLTPVKLIEILISRGILGVTGSVIWVLWLSQLPEQVNRRGEMQYLPRSRPDLENVQYACCGC